MSADKFSNPVVQWIDHRLPIFSMLDHTAHDYPTPKNLNYMWNFGSLAGLLDAPDIVDVRDITLFYLLRVLLPEWYGLSFTSSRKLCILL